MHRPTLLVVEPEPAQALSARKLVLETAKFNVLTAHSTTEALELFELFPNVDMAVISLGDNIDCVRAAKTIKQVRSEVPVVVISVNGMELCEAGDHRIPSYEPETLLDLVRSKLGDPRRLEPPESNAGAA